MANIGDRYQTSAGGVIYKKENNQIKILVIKDNWGEWTFPKGFVEKNEKYENASIREISEELGIDAKELKFVKKIGEIEFDYFWNKKPVHKKVIYFLYEWIKDQEFHLLKEEGIQEAKWINLEKLKEKIGYKKDTMSLVIKVEQFFNQ